MYNSNDDNDMVGMVMRITAQSRGQKGNYCRINKAKGAMMAATLPKKKKN